MRGHRLESERARRPATGSRPGAVLGSCLTVTGLLAALAISASCAEGPSERILNINASGGARAFVFLDIDDNGSFAFGTDTRVVAQPVVFQPVTGHTDGLTAVTDTAGVARAAPLGAGRYFAAVPTSVLGDSLEMFSGDAPFTVGQNDTIEFTIGLRFRSLSPSAARALPLGAKAWVRGVALNAWGTFGDSTVHVAGQAAIRLSRVPVSGFAAGDTARFFGTRAQRDGQPTFIVQRVIVETQGGAPPDPSQLVTAIAAAANGGQLDAALVRVNNATITDTTRNAFGNRMLTVDDGAGPLRVELVSAINFDPPPAYSPGSVLDITGLLVPNPDAPGTWLLRPRSRSDIPAQGPPRP